MESKVPKLE